MSKLVPCRKCEHQVEKTAKKCPLCGAASPAAKGSDLAKGCLTIIVLLVIVGFVLKSCISGSDETEVNVENEAKISLMVNTDLAQNYIVLKTETYVSHPERLGLKFIIYSENADTFEKRAQTLIKASHDLLEGRDLYEVMVRLSALPTIEPEYIHAGIAFYHPHKKNTWGDEQQYVWDVVASPNHVVNGKIEEDGKLYPLDFMTTKSYLKE